MSQLTKAQAKFIHFREGEGVFRSFTVAYHLDEATGQFHAGFAFCSKKDNYDRKKGAALALERLNFGLEGVTMRADHYLPISDVTFFTDARALRAFAVTWALQFA